MTEYVWRQSGLDAADHAFHAEGGFVIPLLLDIPEVSEAAEYLLTVCGQALPVAFVMHHEFGVRCARCALLVHVGQRFPRLITHSAPAALDAVGRN